MAQVYGASTVAAKPTDAPNEVGQMMPVSMSSGAALLQSFEAGREAA
jgi:hypothetical protein